MGEKSPGAEFFAPTLRVRVRPPAARTPFSRIHSPVKANNAREALISSSFQTDKSESAPAAQVYNRAS
jgi:hypothetical protein